MGFLSIAAPHGAGVHGSEHSFTRVAKEPFREADDWEVAACGEVVDAASRDAQEMGDVVLVEECG
jgi:hypothetical protein